MCIAKSDIASRVARACFAAGLAMPMLAPHVLAGSPQTGGATPPAAKAEQATTQPQMPDAYRLNILIRTTVVALNQANMTGNYSVLRDLGSPRFQASNTDASLGQAFSFLRGRNLDLSPVLFFDPKLIREPRFEAGGMLRLTGFIPTAPEQVLFDMGFERVGAAWRLSAIVIDMQQNTAAATAGKKAPAKKNVAADKPSKGWKSAVETATPR